MEWGPIKVLTDINIKENGKKILFMAEESKVGVMVALTMAIMQKESNMEEVALQIPTALVMMDSGIWVYFMEEGNVSFQTALAMMDNGI